MATNVTAHPFRDCDAVSPACPVSATTLGYYPNKGINVFFAVGFGAATLALLVPLALGLFHRRRTWGYACFIAAGAALELAGYAARVPLHDNPWDQQAFETQICAIILAPTLICVGIYLTLQHVCLALAPALSRVRPTLYPWLFVPADVSCLLVQAIGGALAASAGYTNTTLLDAGNRAIIAGIVLQVVVLAAFGLASLDFYVRVRRQVAATAAAAAASDNSADAAVVGTPLTADALVLWHNKRFRTFAIAVAVAYVCILIRCIYRVAEMAGGWGNKIMQDEPSFIVLEGFLILIAVCILAGFQPAYLFPAMADSRKQRKALKAAAAAADADADGEQGRAGAAGNASSNEKSSSGQDNDNSTSNGAAETVAKSAAAKTVADVEPAR